MQTTQQIEDKLVITFDQMTQELQRSYITQWTSEIYTWINQARAYIEANQSMINKLQATAARYHQGIQEVLKKRQVAKDMIQKQNILSNGYILLNKIGEIIRGEEIQYSITVSKTGRALSSGSTGGVYTWKLPLSSFLKLLNFSSSRIVLKSPQTIYKMLEAQIAQNEQSLSYEKWSDEKLQSFAIFAKQARGASHGYWSKVNEGNILEAFLRFLDGGHIPSYNSSQEYWHSVATAMKQTMSKPDAFYQGGDLYDQQIKGLRASVTNINTLISALSEVLQVLSTTESGMAVLRQHIKQKYISQLEVNIEKDQNVVVEQLLKKFTSSIDRIHIEI